MVAFMRVVAGEVVAAAIDGAVVTLTIGGAVVVNRSRQRLIWMKMETMSTPSDDSLIAIVLEWDENQIAIVILLTLSSSGHCQSTFISDEHFFAA